MDTNWIDSLTHEFHDKISDIVNVWLEIGVANEKLTTRSNSLKQHVDSLLNDMMEEELKHRDELEKSIDSLNNDIKKLCCDLQINYHYDLNESLVKKESSLLKKKNEILINKEMRMKKFHELLHLEDELCSKLFEYKLDLDPELTPTERQLDDLEKKINDLENIKINRITAFLIKRQKIIKLFGYLDQSPPKDAFIQNVIVDDAISVVPLSVEFLGQCDTHINQLQNEYHKNIIECQRLRERYEMLFKILNHSTDISSFKPFIFKNSNDFSYKTVNMLKIEVSCLEQQRLEKIGDFIKNHQDQIREKLHKNFSSHLVNSDYFKMLLNSEDISESLLDKLEIELQKWLDIEVHLEPLNYEIETWNKSFQKLIDIETNLKNPIILKNRGGILLKVEKEKKLIQKELPKSESKIHSMLISLNEKGIQSCNLKINNMTIEEYLLYKWNNAEEEKENDKMGRKLKATNSKMDISKIAYVAKKPLQNQQIKSLSSHKLNKENEFRKPESLKLQSKIPMKKNPISPIIKSNKKIYSNLDRRFSKSYNSLNQNIVKTDKSGSNDNIYALFCRNIKDGAITSSFVEDFTIKKK